MTFNWLFNWLNNNLLHSWIQEFRLSTNTYKYKFIQIFRVTVAYQYWCIKHINSNKWFHFSYYYPNFSSSANIIQINTNLPVTITLYVLIQFFDLKYPAIILPGELSYILQILTVAIFVLRITFFYKLQLKTNSVIFRSLKLTNKNYERFQNKKFRKFSVKKRHVS